MKNWRYIKECNVSAAYGLATDEFLMTTHSGNATAHQATLRLYNYRDHCALSGRFQDLCAEIDIEACRQHGFDYGRRLTGGGAIIMGSQQLGVCLATASDVFNWQQVRELYVLFSKPIINALNQFGIPATFRSRNDLEVGGKKIAGLGVYLSPEGAVQFHTSLLVALDIELMMEVLKIPVQKFSDKRKIHSIEQRMTTISREMGRAIDLDEILQAVKKCYAEYFKIEFDEKPVTETEKADIQYLEAEKYSTEEWLFQNSPQPDMTGMSLKKTPAGLLRTYIALKGNTIKSVLITGDFFGQSNLLNQIEAKLKWQPLEKTEIEKVVNAVFTGNPVENYSLAPQQIVDAIWRAGQRAFAAERYRYDGACYGLWVAVKNKLETINTENRK